MKRPVGFSVPRFVLNTLHSVLEITSVLETRSVCVPLGKARQLHDKQNQTPNVTCD